MTPVVVVGLVLGAAGLDLEAFYKDLHSHPELGLQEKRTAAKMTEAFKRLGLKPQGVGGGVVAILENGAGPVTMVRSELDALPVNEETGLPYKSETPNVMHACGHDLHATTLVGTAEDMIRRKSEWHGTLVFVAQPAEETLKGAMAMFDAGLATKIPKPESCIAMHTIHSVPTGKVGFPPPGPVMTAADNFDITFRGVGTHGSTPQKGIDPVVLASEFVIKMQTLVGRESDPEDTAVITVGSFHAGAARNVISEAAKLELTMRTYTAATRTRLVKRIPEIAIGLAKVAGAPEPIVTQVDAIPSVVNDRVLTERFRRGVTKVLGPDVVVSTERILPSEDFSLYNPTLGCAALRWFVGAASDANATIATHSPRFAPQMKTVLPLAVKATVAGLMELHGAPTADAHSGQ